MNKYIKSVRIDRKKININSYINNIDSMKNLDTLDFKRNITFFVGENGTGKSTLLEAIAVAYGFNPEGGTLNYCFSTYNDVSELSNALILSKSGKCSKSNYFFRAESFFNLATQAIKYGSKYGDTDLHEQSHGESFLSFFQSFTGDGLYLMDEPEAALSPQRQLTLLMQIYSMSKKGAQFIIATHSPILLGIPDADILSFNNNGICLCEYEETESYQVTELFINQRQLFLNKLLK